ncbi:thiamine phosphate synthase [Peribacillus sp. SCS-37]|uniref:thiamine phosphate synthase n=1 Tax=Paraperibacillus esterisolvens TaxID=3115296 RepID=UPI003905A5EA
MMYDSAEIKEMLRLYFIMGSQNCVTDPVTTLLEAISGGITLFQYREKGLGALLDQEKKDMARKLQKICRESCIPFIVNDDINLALELDADGVHIGQKDESASSVRKRIGSKILGVSVHTLEEAQSALDHGADYLGIGPVFPTHTKLDAEPVQGTSLLKSLHVAGITIPIVGIGGITCHNARQVICEGADGIAVISAISLAVSPENAAMGLKTAVLSTLRR